MRDTKIEWEMSYVCHTTDETMSDLLRPACLAAGLKLCGTTLTQHTLHGTQPTTIQSAQLFLLTNYFSSFPASLVQQLSSRPPTASFLRSFHNHTLHSLATSPHHLSIFCLTTQKLALVPKRFPFPLSCK